MGGYSSTIGLKGKEILTIEGLLCGRTITQAIVNRRERMQSCLGTEVEVEDGVGVEIDCVETSLRAVDDLQTLVLLDGQVHQQWTEVQRREMLKVDKECL